MRALKHFFGEIGRHLANKFRCGDPAASGPDDIPPGDPVNDWQVGDQAECIIGGSWVNSIGPVPGPLKGEVRVVRVVKRGVNFMTGQRMVALGFAGWPDASFDANSFRKITPRAEEIDRRAKASLSDLLKVGARSDA